MMTDNMTQKNDVSQERRSSLRLDMENELIELTIFDGLGTTKTRTVTCIDLTHSGIAVHCDEPIAVDTKVEIRLRPNDRECPALVASVLRCQLLSSGWYNIGLLLQQNNKEETL